jgi:hypothetical protein
MYKNINTQYLGTQNLNLVGQDLCVVRLGLNKTSTLHSERPDPRLSVWKPISPE